ncbi:M48 family metallopeptidase [Candidatus Trichorickettsia mobilis]|uniref:M48 family metallopeptidase n=1 Tax=Candidatus Trichorickettsia mobilis TaxID=1346319 RepID=A0ABZ0UTP0_9RICK|nr:SprT family zinc-dependent metalloprotease [Candidatus Trichorickettsia mobilis]WPY01410.1 M48 family metallopeptidase [Candidatus Trichorickettsia mobilis]
MSNYIILEQHGEALKVPVRESQKAKRIGIRITYKSLVELVLPSGIKAEIGHKFLLSKEHWIRRKLQKTTIASQIPSNIIPIFGKSYNVIYHQADDNSVKLQHEYIEVYSRDDSYHDVLRNFLKHLLLQKIVILAAPIIAEYKLRYNKIRITSNVSKWGSCSSKGNLSFNWRLVFASEEVLKYVVIHEMCHLKEMNHSKNFWHLVSTIEPDYSLSKLWLRKNGHLLNYYLNAAISL